MMRLENIRAQNVSLQKRLPSMRKSCSMYQRGVLINTRMKKIAAEYNGQATDHIDNKVSQAV